MKTKSEDEVLLLTFIFQNQKNNIISQIRRFSEKMNQRTEREKMTVDLKGRNGSKRERDGGKERGMEKRRGNVK